jgi:hypothetical protein
MIRDRNEGEAALRFPNAVHWRLLALGYQLGSVRIPWHSDSNQHMNVLRLIGLAALDISLAHHLALLVCE